MPVLASMPLSQRYFGTYKNVSDEYKIERTQGRTNPDDNCTKEGRQFFFLYQARINAMRPMIDEAANRVLDPHVKRIRSLIDLKAGEDTFIVGVIIKRMRYRQSALYEFLEEDTLERDIRDKLNCDDNIASNTDYLEFEDSHQKMRLAGNIDKDHFVTGNVLGIHAVLEEDNFMHVKRVVLPDLSNQSPWPKLCQRDCYILFISGIGLRPDSKDPSTLNALTRLCSWLANEHDDEEVGSSRDVCRVVIAGESVRITNEDVTKQKLGHLGIEDSTNDEAVGWLDRFLSSILGMAPVDLMGGPNDPCSLLLPQRPMPRVLFPDACNFGACFNTVTNPYKFQLEGICFLGTSGQNILDMQRLTHGLSTTDLMQQCLERGHLFPTAPDTLDAWSFENRDPFVMTDLPHVFFAGNQTRLNATWMDKCTEVDGGSGQATTQVSKTLLLALPAFSQTKKVALVNLKNMRVREMDFSE